MERKYIRRIRIMIGIAIVGLVLSGITAFPIETELRWLTRVIDADGPNPSALDSWLVKARDAVIDTNTRYPFLAYGCDWLAFGHLVIAVFFIGPLMDPARYRWNLIAGIIACIGVIPLALIAGAVREIPLFWQAIDCSFGVFCFFPLLLAVRWTGQIKT